MMQLYWLCITISLLIFAFSSSVWRVSTTFAFLRLPTTKITTAMPAIIEKHDVNLEAEVIDSLQKSLQLLPQDIRQRPLVRRVKVQRYYHRRVRLLAPNTGSLAGIQ